MASDSTLEESHLPEGNGPATVSIHVGPEQRPRIQIQISEDEEGSSSMSSVFTLCNSAIGAGVLSLPYAFRYSGGRQLTSAREHVIRYTQGKIGREQLLLACAGAIGCFLLCIVLGACEAFTLYVLSKFSERYRARTYSGLVRRALGRKLSASEPPQHLTA